MRGGNLYFMTCALVINILVHIRDTLSLGPHCGVYKGHVILRFLSSANTSMISSRSIGMSRKIDMIHKELRRFSPVARKYVFTRRRVLTLRSAEHEVTGNTELVKILLCSPSGHYFTYALSKGASGLVFMKINDSRVSSIEETEVLRGAHANILMYRRAREPVGSSAS